ncbi:MAG: AAA family ATPase [Gammaproteobacteria bacterium]|nr:AAA family ATPase [Gammaproteobacteria bacterium]
MAGKRLIQKLKLQNFLSYGSQGEEIELLPLNVLIGPNGSGKSNLIEAFSILKAAAANLLAPIRKGGGVSEFLWKGENENPTAQIGIILDDAELDYQLSFTSVNQRLEIVNEIIHGLKIDKAHHKALDQSVIARGFQSGSNNSEYDKTFYETIFLLKNRFSEIGLYRNWHIGQGSVLRKPQQTDLPEHPLEEDGSNLGLVLNNLQYQLRGQQMLEQFQKFYENAEELSIKIYSGTVQIFIREKGFVQPIPAPRLSDGTLHYLFLMALLLDPNPPPLLCFEEPEIGLHPDIFPIIADLLVEASQRTQLIVTTHSDGLVSALSEYADSVLVCERDNEGSRLHRIDSQRLKTWLEKYSLGELWLMGEIGGNRW